ncbi:MAG: tail fiber domain-containing protein [bacterium]|nr:tail fiber domain-containing protein [bacterium]
MTKNKRFLTPTILTIVAVCFIYFIAAPNMQMYAESGENPVADVVKEQYSIHWLPNVTYKSLVLSISRPGGDVFAKTFDEGSAPSLDLSTLPGNGSLDGSYTYELRVIPATGKSSLKSSSGRALTQSGYFKVKEGKIVIPTPGITENGPDGALDVINDDLIVIGCACIGDDCTSSYVCEGDNALKLKDTRIRLSFEDTSSTSGSYPTTDWRIVINDTTSGGGEYFAIEDESGGTTPFTIEAGAPDNSLYIADDGKIGLGTATPGYPIHIITTGTNAQIVAERTSGAIGVLTGGNSGVNIGSNSNHPVSFIINLVSQMILQTNVDLDMQTGGGTYNSSTGQWVDGSSREYKENIAELSSEEAMAVVKNLKPVTFNLKKNDEHQVGFIAEDVPELVATKTRKGLSSMDIVAVLTKVVQEQQKTITELKKEIAEIKKKQ